MKQSVWFICLLIFTYSYSTRVSAQNPASHSPASDTGMITFQVDMSQWAAKGRFHPATDSIDMPGTMNNWAGSALLQKVDTTMVYQIVLKLTATAVHEFRFRINRDTNNAEINSHLYRVPKDTTVAKYLYNDYDTTTVPITFKCHMYYQIRAGHYDPFPFRDFLDVAGNFNNNGAYDLLFDREHDSIYQVTLNLSRTLISPSIPLFFKFRINGNWSTSELQGGPYRSFFLADTTGGIQNTVDVWYDNINPAIPAPPIASNVYIQGNYYAGQILTGSYSYEDYNLLPEGASIYHWYRADSTTQVNLVPIGDSTINYQIDTLNNKGKYIAFEVTPVATGPGDSLVGKTVRVWTGKIGGVGFGNLERAEVRIYPNPAAEQIIIDHLGNTNRIEIYNIFGQKITTLETLNLSQVSLDVSGFSKGIYLLKIFSSGGYSSAKFIKN